VLPVNVTRSEWMCTLETVASSQLPVPSSVISSQSLVVGEQTFEREISLNRPSNQSRQGRNSLAQDVSPGKELKEFPESPRDGTPALRLGLRYVRGLREEAAQSLVRERMLAPFTSIHDLTRRVPELRKDEITTLAEIGALNAVSSLQFPVLRKSDGIRIDAHWKPETGNSKLRIHRRDALWQVERAVRTSGPLLEPLPEPDSPSPLQPMNHEERLVADFHGTGMTVGPHPMAYRRDWLNTMGIRRASELRDLPSGERLRIGGCVITRQRPGTAKGFVFVSLEDETGVANAIITPDLFHQNRLLLASERFLAIEGILQNQDNVISVKAERVLPLFVTKAETTSHDFH
jgi:error-prone DNA polymerase